MRENSVVRVLWGVMALFMLNVSVDTADPHPNHIPEDLSFNDQESIIEILIEKVLGFEDAIKEYDDHDTDDQEKKSRVQSDFHIPALQRIATAEGDASSGMRCWRHSDSALAEGVSQLDTPPPKG